jgi:hypothetical protein
MAEPLKTYSDRNLQSTGPVEAPDLANSARVARGDLVQNVAFLTGLLHREAYNRYAINLVLFNLRPFWSDCKFYEMASFHDPHKKARFQAVCIDRS